jgi:5-methylcytosine-specific restriction protein B
VSRIFGELITLIEDSKREGAAESLEVVLPYSKERFSVPGNVYLIGTMNTADRSLSGLDIALRRRFSFVEMTPEPGKLAGVRVGGVDVGALLEIMNRRIEVLLDRDHQLGHAYFMGLRNGDDLSKLANVFQRQILPLLQEYFFEDWQRIAWVLNDHRKAVGHRFVVPPPRTVEALFGHAAEVPTDTKLWRLDPEAFGKVQTYQGIIEVV